METVAWFTEEAFPPERRYVTFRASTAPDETASVGVSVTDCPGDVFVSIADEAAPRVTYSTC